VPLKTIKDMNNKTLLAVTSTVALLTFSARADFFDNFDTYTVGSLNGQGGWTVDTGTLNVTAAASSSAPNSVVWASSASSRAHIAVGGTGIAATALDWSFKFDDVGATRDYNALYAYTGAWTVGLQTAMGFGDYNSVSGKYMGRYSSITGATYADGALSDGGTAGWFSLGNGGGAGVALARGTATLGWHFMEVKGLADPVNAGKAEFQFYIDNNLVGTVANLTSYNLTFATIGGAVSVGITGGNTDDYSVTTALVPEPSTLALSLLGGFGLASAAISRRRRA
jgi:hypothetical protein